MSALAGSGPVVAVASDVQLLAEALASALEGIARVVWLPAGAADLAGMLGALNAGAVVVDSPQTAEALAASTDLPVVHVELRQRRVRLLKAGEWVDGGDDSVESIRNLLVHALLGKEAAA